MNPATVFLGGTGADPADGVPLFLLSGGVDDAGVPFAVYGLSQWLVPALGGSSCAFYDVYITITWTMDVTLRFKPILDERADSEDWSGGTIDVVSTDVALVSAGDGARRTATYRIPLIRRVLNSDGVELTRNNLVGTRLRLELQSVGTLGSGELILDGAEVEYEEVVDDKPQEG